MPGPKTTQNSKLKHYYRTWQDILIEQIETYKPDVIICGYTFTVLNQYFNIVSPPNIEGYGYFKGYIKDQQIIINAYHPGYPKRLCGNGNVEDYSREYVNAILNTYNKLKLT